MFPNSTMAEGFEHYHIPQQSREEKLCVLSHNQISFVESSSTMKIREEKNLQYLASLVAKFKETYFVDPYNVKRFNFKPHIYTYFLQNT